MMRPINYVLMEACDNGRAHAFKLTFESSIVKRTASLQVTINYIF